MSTFHGRFFFKLTDNNNLIGEFSNDHSKCKRIYTEGADLVQKDGEKPFIGIYYTTWHEDDKGHEACLSKLKIEEKPNCTGIFSLEWRTVDSSAKIWFKGEGMLCDGVLIGNYYNLP